MGKISIRFSKRYLNIYLVIISFLAGIFLCEILLRFHNRLFVVVKNIINLKGLHKPSSIPSLLCDLKPGVQKTIRGINTVLIPMDTGTMNDHIKKKGQKTILLLGDSMIFGSRVELDSIFAQLLEKYLNIDSFTP